MVSFDQVILDLTAKWNIPGGAVAVVKDGRLVLARGYGLADVDCRVPVQPDSLFRIASISKPITRSVILKLQEDGKLDLSDRAVEYLDHLMLDDSIADGRISRITIKQLLEHTGGWDIELLGFDPMFYWNQIARQLDTSRPPSCEGVIRYMFTEHQLNHPPGATYAYSNFGYCIQGRIIEAASGETYEDYVKIALLEPIGITRMAIGNTLKSREGKVTFYDYDRERLVTSVFPYGSQRVPWPYGGFHLEAMDSHGGWIASAVDLVRFTKDVKPPTYKGDWSFNGSLPGTRSRIVLKLDGKFIMAVLFNSRAEDDNQFGKEIATALDEALNSSSIPNHDLFDNFK